MLELAKCLTHLPLRVITVDLHIALFLSEFRQIEVTIVGELMTAVIALVSMAAKCCVAFSRLLPL
jgi:DeoR/GlpR family transcriptional regulator of sugar metabolism